MTGDPHYTNLAEEAREEIRRETEEAIAKRLEARAEGHRGAARPHNYPAISVDTHEGAAAALFQAAREIRDGARREEG